VTLSGKAVFTFCEIAYIYILATVVSTDYYKYTGRFECYIIVRFFFFNSPLHRLLTMAVCQGGKFKRLKLLYGAFSIPRPLGSSVFLPQQVPAFISRGATYTDARDLCQQRRELFPSILLADL
jgi:hypothetical protein